MELQSTSQPMVHSIFESQTSTWQYVVADPATSKAVIIDSVLDIAPATLQLSTKSADELLALVRENNYQIEMILETHAHADHVSAAAYLQNALARTSGHRPAIGIGKRIKQVQAFFGARYQIPEGEYANAFDRLFEDDETFQLGSLHVKVLHLPGHTPDHVGYQIGDNVFAGDSIFQTDVGSARADFPGGSAASLFSSKTKMLSLPEHVKLWVGHDYPPEGRDGVLPSATVAEHRASNKHFKDGITEEEFVHLRSSRDKTLGQPKLIHHALQMNIRGGRLPAPGAAGQRLLHLPLKVDDSIAGVFTGKL